MIKKICIENVKGFGTQKCFDLDIIPNKPSILVAPNGFGKSSFTIAFNSLIPSKLDLHKNHYHMGSNSNNPSIILEYKKQDNTIAILTANKTSNTISSEFDIMVINSKLEAKARTMHLPGGASIPVASMEITPIVLIKTIPERIMVNYTIGAQKDRIANNKTIFTNINNIFRDQKFMQILSENYTILDRTNNLTPIEKVDDLLTEISTKDNTIAEIKNWLENDKQEYLENIDYISSLASLVFNYPQFNYSLIESYLAAIQISNTYHQDRDIFKKACKYKIYEIQKDEYRDIFSFLNSTWKDVKPREKEGSLILSIPKAHHISNGQRDIWTFIALLQKAKNNFKKENCILIIDEVFDYLDDANLTAAQYYISNLIQDLKNSGKKFYPLIFTHLNPYYFNNYTFKDQKVYYLDRQENNINSNMKRLIINRKKFEEINNGVKEDKLSKYFLHYDPNEIDLQTKFTELRLLTQWGLSNTFYQFVNDEAAKYLSDQDFCPFSVCCAVRIEIEKKIYSLIDDPSSKESFLLEHGTKKKLINAFENSIIISDIYFLLGVIYNDGMHWKNNYDNVSPIVNKLNNLTIKNMIKKVFDD